MTELPFECPRCIRTFAAKRTLTRHLQRSHLVDTIIEMQAPQLTTSSAATTTTSTASTTLPKNDSDVCGDNKATAMEQESTFMDTLEQSDFDNADCDGNGKCGKRINILARMNSNSNSKYAPSMPQQRQQCNPNNKLKLLFNDAIDK